MILAAPRFPWHWLWQVLELCALGRVAPTASAEDGHTVLVIYSNNRLLPGNVALDRGLREAVASSSGPAVRVHSEFLDTPNFTGPAHEDVAGYLHAKYAASPPDAILAVSDSAVDFVLRRRERLFPGVPIEYDFAGTIEQALRWHPAARRLLVITGASERDRSWEVRLRHEPPAAAPGVQVEFLAALPTPAVLQRLAALGIESVVFNPGFYEDGEGRVSNPRDSAAQMAAAATAPVYGPLNTFIGSGVVAVRAPSFEAMGRQAAQTPRALFAGTAPAAMALSERMPNELIVDWRQVRRWGIADNEIPDSASVQFKQPTLWQAYRNEVLAAAGVLLQAALIVALLVERRRRRMAAASAPRTPPARARCSMSNFRRASTRRLLYRRRYEPERADPRRRR